MIVPILFTSKHNILVNDYSVSCASKRKNFKSYFLVGNNVDYSCFLCEIEGEEVSDKVFVIIFDDLFKSSVS